MKVSVSSVTAASTAAMSSASGGSGTYSLAPARIAFTASSVSAPMPQATTGTAILSDSSWEISWAMSSATSAMIRSEPCPERSAVSAASMSGAWATLAPRSRAILPAVVM